MLFFNEISCQGLGVTAAHKSTTNRFVSVIGLSTQGVSLLLVQGFIASQLQFLREIDAIHANPERVLWTFSSLLECSTTSPILMSNY